MEKSIHTKEQIYLQKILRELRLKQGLTQKQLALKLGSPQSFVSKYESGERRLDILELRTICKTLDVDFLDFIKEFNSAT